MDIGVSVVVLAVITTPIAGEMPEKISMIMLARRSGSGASIAPVLGSEILNNTPFLALLYLQPCQVGFYVNIEPKPSLSYQVILVTVFILIALIPMFVQKEIGLKVGVMLASMYVIGIFIQFLLL